MSPLPFSRIGEVATRLVQAAILAPSSHNTQPWLFRLRGEALELLADRTRALSVNDPEDRELTLSCGCALFNLRVAAAATGQGWRVQPLPLHEDPDLLARLILVPETAVQPEAAYQALLAARRTWRRRFADEPVTAAARQALVQAAADEGACLHLLDSPAQREQAASLVAEADALLWADPRWRRELAAWMHPRRHGDGLSLPALALPLARAVVRRFDMGEGQAAKDHELASGSPLLAVLSTAGDGPTDWLTAGQALQRVLLAGLQHRLQASYLNQPVQVAGLSQTEHGASLRTRLQALTGVAGTAQVLLRLGVAAGTLPATPRRPVAEVWVSD
jgi:hypothetical protein